MQMTCPGCHKRFNLPETAAGKNVRCRNCRYVISVPGPNEIKVSPPGHRAGHDAAPGPPSRRTFWAVVIGLGLVVAGGIALVVAYAL
jgi:hypothetical protein